MWVVYDTSLFAYMLAWTGVIAAHSGYTLTKDGTGFYPLISAALSTVTLLVLLLWFCRGSFYYHAAGGTLLIAWLVNALFGAVVGLWEKRCAKKRRRV